jgi:hypothetical protein
LPYFHLLKSNIVLGPPADLLSSIQPPPAIFVTVRIFSEQKRKPSRDGASGSNLVCIAGRTVFCWHVGRMSATEARPSGLLALHPFVAAFLSLCPMQFGFVIDLARNFPEIS